MTTGYLEWLKYRNIFQESNPFPSRTLKSAVSAIAQIYYVRHLGKQLDVKQCSNANVICSASVWSIDFRNSKD
jgi:hypothetical protein